MMENKSYEVLVIELLQQILNELKALKGLTDTKVVNVTTSYDSEKIASQIAEVARSLGVKY